MVMGPQIKEPEVETFGPKFLLPWIEAVANKSGFQNTFVHIQDEQAFATFGTGGVGLNSPMKKKVASFGAFPVQHDDDDDDEGFQPEDDASPMMSSQKKLSRSNSWPLLGPSTDEVYVTSMVSKMFYKPKQEVSGLAQKRSVSFASTDGFQTDKSHSDDGDRSDDNDWEEVAANDCEVKETSMTKPPNNMVVQQAAAERVALPSIGSADHFKGTCRPCCFKLRQRCSMGARCKHCHLDHEKVSRPGKKTRDRMRRQRLRSEDNDDNESQPDGDYYAGANIMVQVVQTEGSMNGPGESAGDGWCTLRL